MKKILILIIILMTMFIILPHCIGNAEHPLNINDYNINILTQNERIYIEENIDIKGNSNETYTDIFIWLSESAENIKIIFYGTEIESIPYGNNTFSVDISSYNISQNSTINLYLKYFYDKNINEFRKITLYNTDFFSINFNEETIFTGLDLSHNSNILIPLYKPSEAPISIYLFIAIFLIILLALLSTYYKFRKQKTSKIKNISNESKELLSTKKLLLMTILKQLEKEYRAKKISDETYNKLRDFYKQEAVDSMKKLQDFESKII